MNPTIEIENLQRKKYVLTMVITVPKLLWENVQSCCILCCIESYASYTVEVFVLRLSVWVATVIHTVTKTSEEGKMICSVNGRHMQT